MLQSQPGCGATLILGFGVLPASGTDNPKAVVQALVQQSETHAFNEVLPLADQPGGVMAYQPFSDVYAWGATDEDGRPTGDLFLCGQGVHGVFSLETSLRHAGFLEHIRGNLQRYSRGNPQEETVRYGFGDHTRVFKHLGTLISLHSLQPTLLLPEQRLLWFEAMARF